jgi:formylglycine-generating enzyme required for sulfatase activity
MRRTVITAFACLAACYSPDYTQKPCQDDSGCPVSYACSTEKRCMPGVNSSVTDMGTDPRPKRVEVEVRPSGSFYVGTTFTDGINDTPSFLPKQNPAPFFLDEREVTVADYRACVTAQVCTAPKTGPFGTQGGSARTASRAKTSTRSPVSPRPSPRTSASGWAAGYRPKWSGNMRHSDSVARRPPISGWSSRSHSVATPAGTSTAPVPSLAT